MKITEFKREKQIKTVKNNQSQPKTVKANERQ